MKTITYSAPAKVILSGEHAVVYGKPALVSAINLRLRFSITPAKKKPKNQAITKINSIVKAFLTKNKTSFTEKGFNYSIDSEIPIGAGLGSSAALSVAATAAFLEFYAGRSFDQVTINNLAYKADKYFHQNPSGIDNTAATFGGLIFFRKEFEFLKTISLLNFKIPKKIADSLYLIDSGKPKESTKEMVNHVGSLYTKDSKKIETVFSQIEKQTKRLVVAITKEDLSFFQEIISVNQILLQELNIVSKRTEKIITDISAFAKAKVTGAGGKKVGSGFLLVSTTDKNKFELYLSQEKIHFYKFNPSYDGVRKENER